VIAEPYLETRPFELTVARAGLEVSFSGWAHPLETYTRALEDAQMDWADIDAVVIGKAPDLFEGIMKPELYLTDALGAAGKPMFRVHTAGSVGGATGIVASHLVETGRHRRVLALGYQKQSEGNAQFALGSGKGASLGAGGAFAPFIRAYIHRSGAPEHIGWKVAVKDRLNALKNPYAHLKIEDISNAQQRRVNTDAAGLQRATLLASNGLTTLALPDGTAINVTLAGDPRWGMQAP